MVPHLLGEHPLLHLVSVLKKLLYHVITENIRHQLECVGLNFAEELLFLITISSLELLLNEARSMLISTEFNNVMVDILLRH